MESEQSASCCSGSKSTPDHLASSQSLYHVFFKRAVYRLSYLVLYIITDEYKG